MPYQKVITELSYSDSGLLCIVLYCIVLSVPLILSISCFAVGQFIESCVYHDGVFTLAEQMSQTHFLLKGLRLTESKILYLQSGFSKSGSQSMTELPCCFI